MKYSFVVLFAFLSTAVAAQNLALIDSLKRQLEKADQQKKFLLLNAIGWEYRFAFPDSTIFYASKAFVYGKQIAVKKDLAKPLNYMGVAYNYKGEQLASYDQYQKAIRIAETQRDSDQLAYTNNNIGRLLFEQGLLSKSYDYFVKALKIFRVSKDSSGIAYANQSLGNLYKSQKDYKKAEESFKTALAIRYKLKNKRDIMSALVYLGILSQETGDLEKSNEYFHEADSVGTLINDRINLAEIKILLSENYLKTNKIEEAERIGKDGFKSITSSGNVRILPRAYLLIGRVYAAQKNYKLALVNFLEALKVATETKAISFQMDAHYELAQVAKIQGRKAEEIRNMNTYLVLKDSIKDLDLARQVERLQFQLQIDTKDRENELLKADQARNTEIILKQRFQNMILYIVLGFITIIAGIMSLNSRKRRRINEKLALQTQQIYWQREEISKQNVDLSKRNQQLLESNTEKDTLMSIVAHDLKSPFNNISGLMTLLEAESLSIEQREYLRHVKGAAKAGTDLIVDLLDAYALEEENAAPDAIAVNLDALLKDKIRSFTYVAESKNIAIRSAVHFEKDILTDPKYINRILDNLISNSLKFSEKNTTVTISGRHENGKLILSVKDEGPGFSEEDTSFLYKKFKKLSARPSGGESSNGLGLAIVKTLVDRLNGKIELISEPKKGSEFILKIPAVSA